MVTSVNSLPPVTAEVSIYQRKRVQAVSNRVEPGGALKPRIGGPAPPELLARIKQLSEAAKGAQAQYNAIARQMAALNGPLSPEIIALRQHFGNTNLTSFTSSPATDPSPAFFVDTKI